MRAHPILPVLAALLLARCNCDRTALKPPALRIEVQPTTIDFGAQFVGVRGTRVVQVRVTGRGAVQLQQATFLNGGVKFFTDFAPTTVSAQSEYSFNVEYESAEPSEDSDTLVLTTNLQGTKTVEIALHGRAFVDCVDADGDTAGSGTQCPLGPDCDDTNAAVHPGATEMCGNGLDDDCDEATSDICPCSVDNDGDTYVQGANCERPDCDDARMAVHPGATEVCGNGLDDDCDPSTTDICPCSVDNDGDTYVQGDDCPRPDCDDDRAYVNPGAIEICGNGIDEDCNPLTSDLCECVDHDMDGYGLACPPGPDCDDERAEVNPGQTEICGNGLDDDCNQATPDNCPVETCPTGGCGVGCADGEREAFTDMTRYPKIAGCSGGWYLPGVWREDLPQCSRRAGDDGMNPWGNGCNASDLCSVGWHVCRTAYEVATHSVDGCAGANSTPSAFFTTRQSGNGCGLCSVSSNPADVCGGDTCRASCYSSSAQTNDIFGCGTIGDTPASTCAPLNRFGQNNCNSLPSPWQCSGAVLEALEVIKPGSAKGGVLCCAD